MPVNLRAKKRLASRVIGVGVHRIRLNPEHLDDVANAITRADIRGLVTANTITVKPVAGTSRGRARYKKAQRSKRGTKQGSKQGTKGARTNRKRAYMAKVRSLRYVLRVAKDRKEITNEEFWMLYKRVGGNTVRNKAHLRELISQTDSARS